MQHKYFSCLILITFPLTCFGGPSTPTQNDAAQPKKSVSVQRLLLSREMGTIPPHIFLEKIELEIPTMESTIQAVAEQEKKNVLEELFKKAVDRKNFAALKFLTKKLPNSRLAFLLRYAAHDEDIAFLILGNFSCYDDLRSELEDTLRFVTPSASKNTISSIESKISLQNLYVPQLQNFYRNSMHLGLGPPR